MVGIAIISLCSDSGVKMFIMTSKIEPERETLIKYSYKYIVRKFTK